MTLYIMRGLPASGKTTWARHEAKRDLTGGTVRISRDDLRVALFGSHLVNNGVVPDEDFITDIQQRTVRRHLRAGRNVIIDDLNLRDRYVRQWAGIAESLGVEWQTVDLRAVDLLTCINHDAQRERRGERSVGRGVIEGLHKRLVAGRDLNIVPAAAITPQFEPIIQNPGLPDAWVFDVDGTLADISYRDPFHTHRIPEDSLHEDVAQLLADLRATRAITAARPDDYPRIIIATGRQAADADPTRTWLRKQGIDYDEFHCRTTDEGTKVPDTVVKYRMARDISSRYRIRGWVDDRPKVSRMLRSIGIQVFQVGDPDVEF